MDLPLAQTLALNLAKAVADQLLVLAIRMSNRANYATALVVERSIYSDRHIEINNSA